MVALGRGAVALGVSTVHGARYNGDESAAVLRNNLSAEELADYEQVLGMPLLGWALGSQLLWLIAPVDHWIAFVLLAFIGGKMLWEAVREGGDTDDCRPADKIDLGEFLILAIATSIDALAVGISFAALAVDIVASSLLIFATTFVFTLAGVKIGNAFGARYEKPASITGGVILILLGLKILLEHLGVLVL